MICRTHAVKKKKMKNSDVLASFNGGKEATVIVYLMAMARQLRREREGTSLAEDPAEHGWGKGLT